MKVIFASTNKGKFAEITAILSPLGIEICSPDEFNIQSAPETGLTFVENALLKARHASKVSKLPAIADDSGLVVPYLKGAPGIYSARYAGAHGHSDENNAKLLKELQLAEGKDRDAYFYCSLVFIRHALDPTPIICEGRWDGFVATEPMGEQGFGYDPIFFIPPLNKTAGQLSLEIKNKSSHRGAALQALIQKIRQLK